MTWERTVQLGGVDLVTAILAPGSGKSAPLYSSTDAGSSTDRLPWPRHGVADADLVIVSTPVDLLGKVSAGDLGNVEALISHIERVHGIRISVIAVDTVSRAMPGGDENQPADMSRFVDKRRWRAPDPRYSPHAEGRRNGSAGT